MVWHEKERKKERKLAYGSPFFFSFSMHERIDSVKEWGKSDTNQKEQDKQRTSYLYCNEKEGFHD